MTMSRGALACRLAEQGEGRAQHGQPVGRWAGADAQGHVQRRSGRVGEAQQVVGERVDQLVQASEADVRLVLDATALDHPRSTLSRHRHRGIDQGRLADPRLAGEQA